MGVNICLVKMFAPAECAVGGFVACNVISLTLFGYEIYDCRGILKHVSESYNFFRVARVCRRRVVGLIYTLRLEL